MTSKEDSEAIEGILDFKSICRDKKKFISTKIIVDYFINLSNI
jgi:hypothetical protein